jgi:hypothetical protein
MWLATTRGFYSAVAHRDLPGHIMVRARARADLEALRELLQLPDGAEHGAIVETPRADYPVRLVLTDCEWRQALVLLADDVDYPNFKDAVKDRQGAQRANTYMGAWSAFRGIERENRGRREAQLLLQSGWSAYPAPADVDWSTVEFGEMDALFPPGDPVDDLLEHPAAAGPEPCDECGKDRILQLVDERLICFRCEQERY